MPNTGNIFFSQKGTKNSQFAANSQSENYLMCNAQIPKDRIRGREVVNKSLNKMLIKRKFP